MLRCHNRGLGWCAFARHYLRNHFCFLFLRVLRCFSSPGLPHPWDGTCLTQVGCPIRKSALHGIFAPKRGLSQLVTSFFASESQGILHVPFSPFLFLYSERRLYIDIFRRSSVVTHTLASICRLLCCFDLICINLLVIYSLLSFSHISVSSEQAEYPTCQCTLFRVENNGFEPLTLCLQSRCSSQLS